jgi:two-component system CheB/CheR fusion protein
VKANGGFIQLAIEVVPLPAADEGPHYLILFQERPAPPAAPPKTPSTRPRRKERQESGTTAEIDRLQQEVIASREYLQAIIQDLEAANEELQSANEEILSSNEELQSTNEELDTAKEELQSTNEELNTLNEELHGRNEELGRTNSDLLNLLNSVQIAIVIVSSDMRVRRFTPMAERVLNLIPGDIGRPIGQIKPNINVPDLEAVIQNVIDTITVQQLEAEDSEGRSYSLTIRPYKDIDNRISGAVLALFDVNEVRRHEREALQARAFAEAVLDAAPDPLIILDGNLRVQSVNSEFCRRFQTVRSDAEGRHIHELANGAWNLPDLQRRLEQLVSDGKQIDDLEVLPNLPGAGAQRLKLRSWRSAGSAEHPAVILLEIRDNNR